MKKIIAVLFLLSIILVAGCTQNANLGTNSNTNSQTQDSQAQPHKLVIAATFYPLYDITREIAGDAADVYSIVPTNAEPHEYETTPQDIIKLNQADAFVTMGVAFAGFEDQLIKSAKPSVRIIPAGKGITQIDVNTELGDPSDEESGNDPHIWVSPKNAIKMAQNIVAEMIAADPKNSVYYQENANALITSLQELDSSFSTQLKDCKQDTILAAHDAYSYLARDYGFKSYFISGLTPEAEPTPKQITRLIDIAKEHNLKYIFYESAVDPKVSKTIAEQIGATALPLSPLEYADDPNDTYISIMQKNLNNLKIAMECR